MAATKVELFEQIRRDSWHGGLSVRALAAKYGVHRRLVREALTRFSPAPRKTPERRSARLEPFKAVIDGWLRADLDAPRKQRHTATRVHARLLDEHDAGGVSYAAVRDYVARRRPEIRIEEGRGPAKVFIPQHHPPGLEAEVDFGELWVRLAGVLVKCYLFAFRMSYSGKAVHLVSATCGQEAFLEGHVHAFTILGGVPAWQIRYDNLTPAVTRVLRKGRARIENPRWTAFRSHYRFAAFYCEPGIEGAHEKGGVEGQVGYFRRNYLVPVPEVGSLAELNERIAAAEEAEDGRRIGTRIRTIGQDFAAEVPRLIPMPDEPFETGLLLSPRVDRYSQLLTELPEMFPQVNGQMAERRGMVADRDRGRGWSAPGSGQAGGSRCGSAAGDRWRVGAVPARRPGRGRGGRGLGMVRGSAGCGPVGGHGALVRHGPASLVPVLAGDRG